MYNQWYNGDFNLSGINLETLTSINSQEVKFLDLLDEIILNQFDSGSTNNDHNTLDFILSNVDQLPVSIGTKIFSDHYPTSFSCNFDRIDANIKSGFSSSSFIAQAFNFYLSDLFKILDFTDIKTLDYPEHWYSYLREVFSQCVKMNKDKRRKASMFFSSHTMHLTNQKETNLRKLTKNRTLLLSLKQKEFKTSLNESVELDKQIFIKIIIFSCSSPSFRLLQTIGFSKSLPSVMFYSGVSLSSISEITNGFNTFFGSVFLSQN